MAVKAGKVAMRNGEVRSGEAVKDRLGWVRYVVVRQEVCKGIGAVCSGEVR